MATKRKPPGSKRAKELRAKIKSGQGKIKRAVASQEVLSRKITTTHGEVRRARAELKAIVGTK